MAGPILLSSPVVALPARSSLLSIDDDPQPPNPDVVFNVVIFRCPPTVIFGTCLQQSSANSPEQSHRGEEDSIHHPLSYFLLIVVFVTIKEIIIVHTSLPSHSSACCTAVTVTATVAIVTVALRPLQGPVTPLWDSSCRRMIPTNTTAMMGLPRVPGGGGTAPATSPMLPSYAVGHPVLDVSGRVLKVGRVDVLVFYDFVAGRLAGGHHHFLWRRRRRGG